MSLSTQKIASFRQRIWEHYENHGRHNLPWRQTDDEYKILVSEIMLQQTQVARVIPKYEVFIKELPNFKTLAEASTNQVLRFWQGLGYNRRALNLQHTAQQIMLTHDGILPDEIAKLIDLPGIGQGTAGSLMAFAFNRPVVFIETNIRRVFIDYFFGRRGQVSDAEILPLVEQALPKARPREWYWALMDYGAYLATIKPNPNRASRHYARQSTFAGSHRQLRGELIRFFLAHENASRNRLRAEFTDDRLPKALTDLIQEGFLTEQSGAYRIR